MKKKKWNKFAIILIIWALLLVVINLNMNFLGYEGYFFADGYKRYGNYSPYITAFIGLVDLSIFSGIPINRKDLFSYLNEKHWRLGVFIIFMLIINVIELLAICDIINFLQKLF